MGLHLNMLCVHLAVENWYVQAKPQGKGTVFTGPGYGERAGEPWGNLETLGFPFEGFTAGEHLWKTEGNPR